MPEEATGEAPNTAEAAEPSRHRPRRGLPPARQDEAESHGVPPGSSVSASPPVAPSPVAPSPGTPSPVASPPVASPTASESSESSESADDAATPSGPALDYSRLIADATAPLNREIEYLRGAVANLTSFNDNLRARLKDLDQDCTALVDELLVLRAHNARMLAANSRMYEAMGLAASELVSGLDGLTPEQQSDT